MSAEVEWEFDDGVEILDGDEDFEDEYTFYIELYE